MVCASAPRGRMLGRSARSRQSGQARRCGRQVPRCSVQIAACSLQSAPCGLQRATCRPAGRASRPADRAVQPDKTGRWPLQRRQRAGWASFCSLQVARCSLQAAACRPAGRPCRSAGSRLHSHTAGSARPQGGLCITARRWFGLAGRFPSGVGRRVHGLDQARAGAVAANHQRIQALAQAVRGCALGLMCSSWQAHPHQQRRSPALPWRSRPMKASRRRVRSGSRAGPTARPRR